MNWKLSAYGFLIALLSTYYHVRITNGFNFVDVEMSHNLIETRIKIIQEIHNLLREKLMKTSSALTNRTNRTCIGVDSAEIDVKPTISEK